MSDARTTSMPPVQFADANGIRLAYFEAGERRGPPVVFLHGFPELAFSWRHQLRALAAAGRWAVAPDQRGYGLSDAPEAVEAYDMEQLTADLVGLLDHLRVEKAIWCGHDWGGLIGWQMPLRWPDRTAGVIGLNTPFLPRPPVDPIVGFRTLFGSDHYIVFFQQPDAPEAALEADVDKTFRLFMRGPEVIARRAGPEDTGRRGFDVQRALERYDPATHGDTFLPPEDLAVFVESFRRTGFRGGINWYRNFTRNWEGSKGLPHRVPHPALMITAEKDAFLPPVLSTGMELFVPDLDRHMVRGSGHWTQQEKPEEVGRVILDWLERRFPLDASGSRS